MRDIDTGDNRERQLYETVARKTAEGDDSK